MPNQQQVNPRHRCASLAASLLAVALLAGCRGTHLVVPTPPPSNYTSLRALAIHPVSTYEVFICGSLLLKDGVPEGLIMRSEDGGRTWVRMGFEIHAPRRVTYQTLYFTDRLRGWVGGVRVTDTGQTLPIVHRTQDGGNHWIESLLPMDPGMLVTEVHTVEFTSDSTGTVVVQTAHPKTFDLTETWFGTSDSGRSWEVLDQRYRSSPVPRLATPSTVFLNKKQGYRLKPSAEPGLTWVEVTASGGKDWLPVHELSVSAMATYYGPIHPGSANLN